MKGIVRERWMDLCDQAAAEQDAVRFKALVDEIVVVKSQEEKAQRETEAGE